MEKLLAESLDASLLASSAAGYATPGAMGNVAYGPPGLTGGWNGGVNYPVPIAEQRIRMIQAYSRIIEGRKKRNDEAGIAALERVQKSWAVLRDQTFALLTEHVQGDDEAVFVVASEFLLDAVKKQGDLLEALLNLESVQ